MSSLINSAMSGLSAAQSALNTVSNNISSYNVAGYTRQTTILGASNSTLTGGGWVGTGSMSPVFSVNMMRLSPTSCARRRTRVVG